MSRKAKHDRTRLGSRAAAMLVVGLAGLAVLALAAIAVGKSFTLRVERNAHVTNGFPPPMVNKHEAIAIGPKGVAVYTLAGETTKHLLCVTKKTGQMCLTFWPPATVKSANGLTMQAGIKGKLKTFHRAGYGLQLELSGHPLYYFLPDIKSHNPAKATGQLVQNSGTWHVVTG
jgi:predicted lipoprotein with Yx(FWY)xxD motif